MDYDGSGLVTKIFRYGMGECGHFEGPRYLLYIPGKDCIRSEHFGPTRPLSEAL